MQVDRSLGRSERDRVAARVRELLAQVPDPPPTYTSDGSGSLATRSAAATVDRAADGDDRRPGGRHGADEADADAAAGTRHRPSVFARVAAAVPVRLDPGRRAALAVAVAVALAAVLTGLWVVTSKPRALAVSTQVGAGTATAAAPSAGTALSQLPVMGATTSAAAPGSLAATSSAAARVVVDVAGKVRRPGLYRLPAGSRIDDAITAAGGPRPGVSLTSLNLAAVLADGQQILVGVPGAAGAPPVSSVGTDPAAVSGTATEIVDLNTATLEQLETLPRVGPVTGQKILDYRTEHGSFTSVDQLKDISGIGDVTFAGLEPLVSL